MEASDAFATFGIGLLLTLSPTVASATPPESKFQPGNAIAAITTPVQAQASDPASPYPHLTSLVSNPRPGTEESVTQIRALLFPEGTSLSQPVTDAATDEVAAETTVAENGFAGSEEVVIEPSSPDVEDGAVPIAVTEPIAPPEAQNAVEVSQQPTAPTTGVMDAPIAIPDRPATTTDFLPEVESFVENLEQYPLGAEVEFPDYVEPNPNPLYFPTRPDEVQLEGIQPITLQQAIALAERNNPELQTVRLQLNQRRAELQEQRAQLWPDLSLNSSLTSSEGTQQEVSDIFGNSRTVGEDVDTIFGANIRVDYDLFTSGRRSAVIDAAEQNLRVQELQVESQAEQLRFDVSQDYYDLQRADEQLRIRRDALNQALQNLRDAQALERAGVGTRFDVLQAEVDVANRQQELVRSLSDQQNARRQLAQRLNVSQTVNLAAADPVEVNGEWLYTLEESIVQAFRNRAELEQQLVQRDLSESQRRAANAQYGPQISAFGQYEVQDALSDEDSGLEDDWTVGLQLNWSLFDGGAARAQARQQEIGIQIAEANFEDARNTVRFQVEQAYFNLQANETNIATARLNVERATESLRLARLRFQAGVGTQSDVLRSQTELTQAEFNLVEAVLGYNESLAQLRRSVSNFPSGDLGDRP